MTSMVFKRMRNEIERKCIIFSAIFMHLFIALYCSMHKMRNETLEIVSETRTIRIKKMPTNTKIAIKVFVVSIVHSIVLNNLFSVLFLAQ